METTRVLSRDPGLARVTEDRGRGSLRAGQAEGASLLLAGCFLALMLVILFRCPVPPMQDFCEWIYQSFLAKSLLLGSPLASGVAFKTWPVPNGLEQNVMTGLMLVLSPIAAARTFLVGYLLLGTLLLYRISRRAGTGHPNLLLFVLLPLLLVNSSFWAGEVNFQIALLLFLSYVVCDPVDRRRPLVILLVSLLLFVTHILPLLFLCFYVFFETLPGVLAGWKRLLALAPACALALWWHAADPRVDKATSFSPNLHGPAQWLAYRAYVFSKLGVYHDFVYGGLGDFARDKPLYLAGVAANGLVLLCLGAVLIKFLWDALRTRPLAGATLLALVCTVAGLVDPATLLRNANVGERLLLPAVALAVLGSGMGAWRRPVYAGIGTAALLLLAVTALAPPRYQPGYQEVGLSVVNDPHQRTHVFFWTRPYDFAGRVEYAERAAAHQPPGPAPALAFGEGMLRMVPGPAAAGGGK